MQELTLEEDLAIIKRVIAEHRGPTFDEFLSIRQSFDRVSKQVLIQRELLKEPKDEKEITKP